MKSGKPKKSTEKQSDSKALWLTRDTLSKALALGGCAKCHAVHAGGFCLRHFWMTKEIEDDTWPTGGFGLVILCESLTRFADTGLSEVADVEPNSRLTLLRRRQANVFIPGHDCMFCQDNREKEEFLAEVLEELMDEEEFQKPLANHGLCIRHGKLTLQIWKNQKKRKDLFARLKTQVSELADDLREYGQYVLLPNLELRTCCWTIRLWRSTS